MSTSIDWSHPCTAQRVGLSFSWGSSESAPQQSLQALEKAESPLFLQKEAVQRVEGGKEEAEKRVGEGKEEEQEEVEEEEARESVERDEEMKVDGVPCRPGSI